MATWNMKQAVAPKKPLPELWEWVERVIDPDVVALTEAKVPKTGLPDGWTAIWDPDGVGERRRWGVVLAGRGVELSPVSVPAPRNGVLQAADVSVNGNHWATVVGMYGLTVRADGSSCGHGGHSVPALIGAIGPILDSGRADRLIVAGDMNLWPRDVSRMFLDEGLLDLIELTRDERPALERCANCEGRTKQCGHMWTHKNGNSPNAAVQQIDFIFASEVLTRELVGIRGGVHDFPDAWEVSDHAPVVADFN